MPTGDAALQHRPEPHSLQPVQPDATAVTSSERLIEFLADNSLHKKDFAEMIGVTLSYVYSLIDASVSFSTRITTLERIAVVMGVSPDSFAEYRAADDPRVVDAGVQYLQQRQQQLGLTNLQLLKRFPRNKRVSMVDLWRGVLPLPLNWAELLSIALVLDLTKKDIYPFWEARFRQYLSDGGLDPISNLDLTQAMMQGIRQQIGV
jgi:transcriptional regulator with XRE-family HTH domain